MTNIQHSLGIAVSTFIIVVVGGMVLPHRADAAVLSVADVSNAFRDVFGRAPTTDELNYWKSRRADKPKIDALKGAIAYAKAHSGSTGSSATVKGNAVLPLVSQAFVQVYGHPPKSIEKAWWSGRVQCGDLATYRDMLSSMKFHKSKGVTMGTGTKEDFCNKVQSAGASGGPVALSAALGIGGDSRGPVVNIGVAQLEKQVLVTANGPFQVQVPGGSKKTFKKDDVVKVARSGSKYIVQGPGFKDASDSAITIASLHGSILEVQNYTDRGASGTNYNRFRGNIIVHTGSGNTLWAINQLHTEDYLKGLGETTDNAPTQFMDALAVAARTYVLHHHVLGGRAPQDGFDITNTPDDQIYRGYNYELRVPDFVKQVHATAGQVATYAGQLIASVYFSSSDGRTRSAQEVWHSSAFPYLQAKADPMGGGVLRGHGVGMSGTGAVNYVRKDGWDYKKVLSYYYTGIKLLRGY